MAFAAPATQPVTSSASLRPIAIGAALMVMEGYDLVVFGATSTELLQHEPWDLTLATIGLLGSLTPIGMLIGALTVGFLADRLGRRSVTLACVVVLTVGMGLCAVAPTVPLFGIGRLVVGLGTGAVFPAMAPLIFELAPPRRRTMCSAIVLSGISIGGVLAALVADFLVDGHGFRAVYVVGAALGLILFPIAKAGLPESPELLAFRRSESTHPSEAQPPGPLAVLAPRRLVLTLGFAAATICSFLLIFGMNTWLPTLMRVSDSSVGSALTFLMLLNTGATIGGLLMAAYADRIGQRGPVIMCFLVGGGGVALLALDLSTWMQYIVVMIAGGGVLGVQALMNVLISTCYPVQLRGAAIGFILGVGRIGAIAGPSLGGLLLGLRLMPSVNFVLFAVPAAIGAVVIASIGRSTRGSPSAQDLTRPRENQN